jgi:hypothetical protein
VIVLNLLPLLVLDMVLELANILVDGQTENADFITPLGAMLF